MSELSIEGSGSKDFGGANAAAVNHELSGVMYIVEIVPRLHTSLIGQWVTLTNTAPIST
jgi:hypothetical protein